MNERRINSPASFAYVWTDNPRRRMSRLASVVPFMANVLLFLSDYRRVSHVSYGPQCEKVSTSPFMRHQNFAALIGVIRRLHSLTRTQETRGYWRGCSRIFPERYYPLNRLMPCCWETILREETTKHVKQSGVREFLTTSDGSSFCFAGLLLLVYQRVSLNDGEGTVKMRRVVSLPTK